MDASAPPEIIEIKTTERHDIRAEIIEKVARLLCRADGNNPDNDIRMTGGGFQTVHIPEPKNREWYRYRDAAITRLEALFRRQ